MRFAILMSTTQKRVDCSFTVLHSTPDKALDHHSNISEFRKLPRKQGRTLCVTVIRFMNTVTSQVTVVTSWYQLYMVSLTYIVFYEGHDEGITGLRVCLCWPELQLSDHSHICLCNVSDVSAQHNISRNGSERPFLAGLPC